MNNDQKTIDKLFRDLTRVYSTSVTSMIGLNSIQTAIDELVCNDSDLIEEVKKSLENFESDLDLFNTKENEKDN